MKIDNLICIILSAIVIIICMIEDNHKMSKLEELNKKLEHDVDNYKTNWEPINYGVALTPEEIRRLRQLCRCK